MSANATHLIEPPAAVPVGAVPLLDLIVKSGLAPTRGDAARKVKEGAVRVGNVVMRDPHAVIEITGPTSISVGRHIAPLSVLALK